MNKHLSAIRNWSKTLCNWINCHIRQKHVWASDFSDVPLDMRPGPCDSPQMREAMFRGRITFCQHCPARELSK